jgi:outer membrane receptor protein involved in Fe transport
MMTLRAFLLGTCVAICAAEANAQGVSAPADQPVQLSNTDTIETVTVTARKRNERLIDVPVSANAMTQETLERYATTNLTSIVNQLPQVSVDSASSGNGAIITVRGIGSSSVDAGIEQEVTVNIDGVPVSRGRVINQAVFDQQSVEVLKGPQALYFGKNSPAGVISLNSVNPGDQFEGYVRAGYETTASQYMLEGAVTLPMTDDLSARVALRGSDMTGGYVKNVSAPITDPALLPAKLVAGGITLPGAPESEYPGSKELTGRFTLVYTPDDKFDATFKFLGANYHDNGPSMSTVMLSCGPGQAGPMSLDLGSSPARYLLDPYGSCSPNDRTSSMGTIPAEVAALYPGSHGGIPFMDVRTYLSSLTMNYQLTSDLTLTSVTGYYNMAERQFSNYDYTVFSIASGQNDDYNRTWTQELRLSSSFDFPVNFTAGFFYQHDNRRFEQSGSIGYLGPDPITGQTNFSSAEDFYKGETYSGFAELNWKIADNVELAGGARYTLEEKYGDSGNTYIIQPYQAAYLSPAIRLVGNIVEHNVSPQATLSWHPTADTMLYAAYKTGFKSGGWSTPTRYSSKATVDNQQFDQETVRGGEIGLKFAEMDGALTGDITGYHYIFKGLQLTAYDVPTASYFTTNAGSAAVDGIELNIGYQALRELALRASAGYNHARYDSFPGAQCFTGQTTAEGCVAGVQNLAGQPLSRAPDWSGNVGATYNYPLTQNYVLSLTTDVKFSTPYNVTTTNSPFGWQSGFATWDASARLSDDLWEFAVIGRNLTDTVYAVIGGDKPLGPRGQVSGTLGLPRTITLQVSRHF